MKILLSQLVEPASPIRAAALETDIKGLADSIKQNGQLQPIGVVKIDDEKYEVVYGHRRYLAMKFLNFADIEAIEVVKASAGQLSTMQLIENIQRADLSITEEADAVAAINWPAKTSDRKKSTQLGKSRQWLSDRMTVASMPDELKLALHDGQIGLACAMQLNRVTDTQSRNTLLGQAISGKWDEGTAKQYVDIDLGAQAAVDLAGSQPPPDEGGSELPDPQTGQQATCACCKRQYPQQNLSYIQVCREDYDGLLRAFNHKFGFEVVLNNEPPAS